MVDKQFFLWRQILTLIKRVKLSTKEFLKYFALNKLSDLPKPREIEEIMQDEDFIEQKNKIMMNMIEDTVENESSGEGENNDKAE